MSLSMAIRILVVDDHPLTRDALASLLGRGGFEVIGEAADGTEAVPVSYTHLTMPTIYSV